MLYLDLHFSCTQRLMSPAYIQKGSLEDRVCAVFSSLFLIADASVHLFAATYKGFIWAVSQISRKNPPNYYKEAYSHLVKALRCSSVIPFGSLVGFVCPNVFQSEKLQEYLNWKASLTNTSETIENKELKEDLESKNEEIERLKLEINSLKETTPSTVSENNSQVLEDNPAITRTVEADFRAADTMSISSDSDTEFADALEDTSDLNRMLEKELQSKNEEIKRLTSQIDLLKKTLSQAISQHNSKPPQESLTSAKMANSNSSSSEDTTSLSLGSKPVDPALNGTLEKELESKNEEIEKLKSQVGLLNKILYPIENLYPYNQILVTQKALNKSIGDTPIIYGYLSDPVKVEINNAFQGEFKISFLQFCTQTNPNLDSASQILTKLLDKHTFRYLTNPKEGSISAVINTLFGFV